MSRAGPVLLLAMAVTMCLAAVSAVYAEADPAASGPTGRIVLPHKGEASLSMTDAKTSKTLRLTTKDGSFTVPAGQYNLFMYQLIGEDETKEKWAAYCRFAPTPREITVAADSTQTLEVGGPFTASIAASRREANVSLSLKLTGAAGEQCIIRKAAGATEPPSFQAVSPAGEVVWQGKFEFG